MNDLNQLIHDYYNKFAGMPTDKPIVRMNQENDAFEIVVLEILYGKEKKINVSKMSSTDITTLCKYIVAPPDGGIDIVIEHEDIDESQYDFVQVKNARLSPAELKKEIQYMEQTIKDYTKKPENVHENLRRILSDLNFGKEDIKQSRYIIVHRGDDNFFKGQNENETVISGTELEYYMSSSNCEIPKVRKESFGSDSFNNFILYEGADDSPALLINLCGYDLANLAIKYTNTSFGRNILFGQNLRDGLIKSQTFDGMKRTIENEPEKFWFYNNGITILAEDFDVIKDSHENVDKITLSNFSIINGAQTTSALGMYLKESKMNGSINEAETFLKNVFVLTRILKVNDAELMSKIAIYNNTQNPITTRDMASNRPEQIALYNKMINGESTHIYVDIRRGSKAPIDVKLFKHQKTTNETLAQLAFAGFLRDPSTAKDKKKSIFDTDFKNQEYTVNEFYHKIFNYNSDDPETSDGILFKKSKEDIDELLFIYYLYTQSKSSLLKKYKDRIQQSRDKLANCSDDEKEKYSRYIADYEKRQAICRKCTFYCVAYYYAFKDHFNTIDLGKIYRFNDYYFDTDFQKKLIESFRDMFLMGTVDTILEITKKYPSLDDWFRGKRTEEFNDYVDKAIESNFDLEDNYKQYVDSFKAKS